MSKEILFMLMNGDLDLEQITLPENIKIDNEFEDGRECEILYERVYNAKCRLNDRLGTDEDSDIETILINMTRIGRILAFKMYDYGKSPEIENCDIDIDGI